MANTMSLHTVRLDGTAWANRADGRLITRHRTREDAIAAGAAIGESLGVEQVIHDDSDDDTDAPAADAATPEA